MFKKIIKIKGIGNYKNYSASGDVEFKKITLLHGENSKGKTTLSSIFGSLRTNNPAPIISRKTIGYTGDQEVEILVEGVRNNLKFQRGNWTQNLDNLEIFDINFINENVYSGLEIDSGHKKCLHNFVVGEQAVKFVEDINKLKEDIFKKNEDIRKKELVITGFTHGTFSVNEFLSIKEGKNDIEKKLASIQKEIKISNSVKEITQKPLPCDIPILSLGLESGVLDNDLKHTFSDIKEEFLKKVEENKKYIGMGTNSEEWLRAGYSTIKDNTCPFCNQDLTPSEELITAYNQFFSKEYVSFKGKLGVLLQKIYNINIETRISEVNFLIAQNKERDQFWADYTTKKITPPDIVAESKEVISTFNELAKAVRAKEANPLQVITVNYGQNLETAINKFNQKIEAYNKDIVAFNKEIELLKKRPSKDIFGLQVEEKKLGIALQRFEKTISGTCSDILKHRDELTKLNKLKDDRQKELNKLIEEIFKKYEASINEYLEKFSVDFRIKKVSGGNYRGTSRDPYVEYALVMSNEVIPFDGNEDELRVKTALGEGDKSALAFAFFLAKLDQDAALSEKIVIFDDPLSSFDENRKHETIHQLHRISMNVKQLVVLTHDVLVARHFWEELRTEGDCKTLHIVRKSSGSVIEDCQLAKETAGKHYKDYKRLSDFIVEGTSQEDLINVARSIRPLLESYLKNKFPLTFATKDSLGDIIGKIRQATDTDLNSVKSRILVLDEINSYSTPYHHEDPPEVIEAELKAKAEKTLNFISE